MKNFEIINGLHPRGTTKLRNLSKEEKNSVDVENFMSFIKDLHDYVRDIYKIVLRNTNSKLIKGEDINLSIKGIR